MKFNYYDTLVNLVLGYTLLFLIIIIGELDYKDDLAAAYIACGFVMGYFVNAISSMLEPVYFWTFGGKPSANILKINEAKGYSGIARVPFYETQKAINLLKEECAEVDEDKWFGIAVRTIGRNKDSRVPTFNEQYAFSRVMLTFAIISTIILAVKFYCHWQLYVIALPIIFVAWYRCKMRGYYYAREVLCEYINIRKN